MPPPCVSGQSGRKQNENRHRVSRTTHSRKEKAYARIYDRLLEMCVPISCIGISFRKETAQEKLERLKVLIG